jgi:hypothetical protein
LQQGHLRLSSTAPRVPTGRPHPASTPLRGPGCDLAGIPSDSVRDRHGEAWRDPGDTGDGPVNCGKDQDQCPAATTQARPLTRHTSWFAGPAPLGLGPASPGLLEAGGGAKGGCKGGVGRRGRLMNDACTSERPAE